MGRKHREIPRFGFLKGLYTLPDKRNDGEANNIDKKTDFRPRRFFCVCCVGFVFQCVPTSALLHYKLDAYVLVGECGFTTVLPTAAQSFSVSPPKPCRKAVKGENERAYYDRGG